jgi:hypothetical protein
MKTIKLITTALEKLNASDFQPSDRHSFLLGYLTAKNIENPADALNQFLQSKKQIVIDAFISFLNANNVKQKFIDNLSNSTWSRDRTLDSYLNDTEPADYIESAFYWSDDKSIDWRVLNDKWSISTDVKQYESLNIE